MLLRDIDADPLRDARATHRISVWPYVLAVAVGTLASWLWPLGLAPGF